MSPINCPLNKDTTPAFVADPFVFTHVPLFVSSGHYDTFAGFFFSAACFSTVNRQLFSKHKLFQLSIGYSGWSYLSGNKEIPKLLYFLQLPYGMGFRNKTLPATAWS